MKSYDIIFIHPPRTLKHNYGKKARFIRGSYLFIPMGVFAIADLLEREGFGVKIINYPLEQFLDINWSLKDYLKSINFDICGIDLHWIHNSHAVIEIAKIVKSVNSNVKIILGGLSASYYRNDILKYFKEIDAIISGDGETPFLQYIQKVNHNKLLDSVPNLSYQDSSKHIKENPISYVAKTLDDLNFTNFSLLKNAKYYFENSRKMMGISGVIPIGRGCRFNCPLCGGGQRAQQLLAGRNNVVLRSPEKVIEDINNVLNKFKVPSIFFGHGAYPSNLKYWEQILKLLQKENLDIGGDLEIWRLPFPKEMWKMFSKTFTRRDSSISISPRTTSHRVHQKIAKICDPTFNFPLNQIKDTIKNANLNLTKLRIWLTMGYPFQSFIDVMKDFIFASKCILKYGKSNFKPITIMNEAYYIFPGSPAHESPESFGIKLKYNSFLEVVEAFKKAKKSYFYNVINYKKRFITGTNIQNLNTLFLIHAAPLFLTSSLKFTKTMDE
ncbi:MAG: hypothetical protein EU529_00170 [Promethearchaeota archaeon]|nr:MAG: hypothetical protein EU529_00170 [Candidatus Lokiarchaeota archaeon]